MTHKPQIVTANDLYLGDAVYLTPDGGWSRRHEDARVAHDPAAAEEMLAAAAAQTRQVVGAYLATARLDAEGRPHPVHFREAFRTRGPSNYPHGKQAEDTARP